MSASR